MPPLFIGREQELKSLRHYLDQRTASLLVITGRRRVGKSRLVEEFAKGKNFLRFSGIFPDKGVDASAQREEFARRLASQFNLPALKATDWADLWDALAAQTQTGQWIVLLDEISWMAMEDPTFLPKLKAAWDEQFKQNPKFILIICGSISSWIEKNILSSTGYVGRVSYVLKLKELPLEDCNLFWGRKKISAFEKFKILSVTGGVPLYLENIDINASAESNIQRLCFQSGGLLVREFRDIFNDYFSARSEIYEKILRAILNGRLELKAICEFINTSPSGLISEYLNDLEEAGFIQYDFTWDFASGSEKRHRIYRLSDNYTRFYLKYIEPELFKINRGIFEFISLSSLSNWEVMTGLQFENLVLNNRHLVKKFLDIPYGDVLVDNPFYQRASKKKAGCQIDYLIQTRFNTLYLCEIKFSKNLIGSSVIQEIEKKIKALAIPKNFSIRPILIHVNGVTEDLIDQRYFDRVINFSDFLGVQI